MAEIHGTLGRISEAGGKDMEDIRDLYTKGLSYEVATEFDGVKPTTWEKRIITDAHEALRVKIIEMLGSEGPARGEEIIERLPFPQGQIDSILHELEMRNVISVGFYKQTEDAEYILKVDEHKITGGEEDVVEYRWVQNLVMQKSFEQYSDGFTAFDQHILFQKQQEMLYRVDGFRYADWKDLQLDSDVVMGRLLHNRIGYTTRKKYPNVTWIKARTLVGRNGETRPRKNSQR